MKLPASSLYTGSNENSHYRCRIYNGRVHERSSSRRLCLHTHKHTHTRSAIIIHTPTHICTLYTRRCLPIRVIFILDLFLVFSSSCFCCFLCLLIVQFYVLYSSYLPLSLSLSPLNNSFIGITVFNSLSLSIFDLTEVWK